MRKTQNEQSEMGVWWIEKNTAKFFMREFYEPLRHEQMKQYIE